MAELTYNIVYKGKILEGHDFESVVAQLVEHFSLTRERAECLLKSKRMTIKKNIAPSAAKKMGLALKKAGLEVVLTQYIPPDESKKNVPQPIPSENIDTNPPEEPVSKAPEPEEQKTINETAKVTISPFEFHGTGTEYFKIWIVNVILSMITLGIYSAWAKVRRKQYFYGSTRLQDSSFEYLADPVKILKGRIIIGSGLVIGAGFFLPPVSVFIGIIFYLYLFAYFSTKYTNLLYNSTSLSVHQFKADMLPMEYLVIVITNTLGMVVTLGIFYPWAQVRTLCYKLEHMKLAPSGELNNFIAQEQKQVSALGDEAGDFFDMDIGL